MNNFRTKICELCGKEFVPTSGRQKFCKGVHYKECPVCGASYQVKNREDLSKPAVACSYKCRAALTAATSLQRYGVKAPGNNPEARNKAKATMQERFGIDYAMQSKEVQAKRAESLRSQYGVENISQVPSIVSQARCTQRINWHKKLREEFPFKPLPPQSMSPLFKIDETDMRVFILRETACKVFLSRYGHRINPVFSKAHMSFGLVNDGVLYQVLRFERNSGEIHLVDFGTRGNYANPNYYSKLMNAALEILDSEPFMCVIPRTLAVPELVDSLQVELVKEGTYEPYWKIDDHFKRITQKDNLSEMSKKYDYITSDYLDQYARKF